MQTEEIKMRFGRCPYCRTMIYQNSKALIYYCSKCRAAIRGKIPKPTDGTDNALGRLEILSVNTASVFSDEADAPDLYPSVVNNGDQPSLMSNSNHSSQDLELQLQLPGIAASSYSPCGGFDLDQTGRTQNSGYPLRDRFNERRVISDVSQHEHDKVLMNKIVHDLRPSSRRTRRPFGSDSSVLRDNSWIMDSGEGHGHYMPRDAYELQQQRRRSLLSSQDHGTSVHLSVPEPANVTRSPQTDQAFHNELLQALSSLRNFIATVEHYRGFDTKATRRRDSRLFRHLESHLAQKLVPANDGEGRNGSTSSSRSSGERQTAAMKHHCRPVLGGAPFVVCPECSELLQTPMLLSRRKVASLRCGGCKEVLALAVPASTARWGSIRRGRGA